VTVRTVPATVLDVVDANTLTLRLHLGWHITFETTCQLIGVHAPDRSTDEGEAARLWVIHRLADAGAHSLGSYHPERVTLISHALDNHGRTLGQVMVTTPQGSTFDLGLELLEAGHAVPMS
jgi:endonuclease YncB( thermonuclease family)